MDKTTSIVLVIILLIIVGFGAKIFLFSNESSLILFYSNTCPHCQDLEKYIEDNKIDEKIKFDRKEVSENAANSQLLRKKNEECNKTDSLGVPFFYADGKCYMGNDEIIGFFNSKLNTK